MCLTLGSRQVAGQCQHDGWGWQHQGKYSHRAERNSQQGGMHSGMWQWFKVCGKHRAIVFQGHSQ